MPLVCKARHGQSIFPFSNVFCTVSPPLHPHNLTIGRETNSTWGGGGHRNLPSASKSADHVRRGGGCPPSVHHVAVNLIWGIPPVAQRLRLSGNGAVGRNTMCPDPYLWAVPLPRPSCCLPKGVDTKRCPWRCWAPTAVALTHMQMVEPRIYDRLTHVQVLCTCGPCFCCAALCPGAKRIIHVPALFCCAQRHALALDLLPVIALEAGNGHEIRDVLSD